MADRLCLAFKNPKIKKRKGGCWHPKSSQNISNAKDLLTQGNDCQKTALIDALINNLFLKKNNKADTNPIVMGALKLTCRLVFTITLQKNRFSNYGNILLSFHG